MTTAQKRGRQLTEFNETDTGVSVTKAPQIEGITARSVQRDADLAGAPPGRLPLLHFVYLGLWGGSAMPFRFSQNLDRWKEANIGRETRVWNLGDVRRVLRGLEAAVPGIQDTFERSASPIQKADMARYAILYAYGGWYFDLDSGVECKYESILRGDGPARGCSNRLDQFEAFLTSQAEQASVAQGGSDHMVTVFWERGRLSLEDATQSARRTCRQGVPEYRTRLANYGIWSSKGNPIWVDTLKLAIQRLRALQSGVSCGGGSSEGAVRAKEYEVLWATGPDLLTESVLGVRESVGPGVAGLADPAPSAPALFTRDSHRILIVDPKAHLYNANTWSWRGKANPAMAH